MSATGVNSGIFPFVSNAFCNADSSAEIFPPYFLHVSQLTSRNCFSGAHCNVFAFGPAGVDGILLEGNEGNEGNEEL